MKRDRTNPTPFPDAKTKPGTPTRTKTPAKGMAPPTNLETFKRQSSAAPRQYAEKGAAIEGDAEITVKTEEVDPLEIEISTDEFAISDRVTVTNEVELETARLQSVVRSSSPPPPRPSLSGEMPNILSLANAQAPTVPPPRDYDSAKMTAAAVAPAPNPPPDDLEPPRPKLESLHIDQPFESGEQNAHTATTGEGKSVDPIVEMRDRFSLGDYTGALEIAEAILKDDPSNAEVTTCAENSRQVLIKMYSARIGPLDRVPVVLVPHHQMRWLSIDHRAGFVLSHIDGTSSVEMILDVSGMPKLDALKILNELVQQRIISFR
jgi:hypothetical protein